MSAASAAGAEVVRISGITPALSASCAALITVIDRLAAGPGILAFDVNHRAALWPPGAAASPRRRPRRGRVPVAHRDRRRTATAYSYLDEARSR
jgi:sugar/nucleoside kinase (ribokinase family)